MLHRLFYHSCVFLLCTLCYVRFALCYDLHILSVHDKIKYKSIFRLDEEHRFRQSDLLLNRLNDKTLVGYVLAHRYFLRGYRVSYRELLSWLHKYHDLGIARRVYYLAMRKRGRRCRRFCSWPERPTYHVPFFSISSYVIQTHLNEETLGAEKIHLYHARHIQHTYYGRHVVWRVAYYIRHRRFSYAIRYLRMSRHRLYPSDYGDALAELVKSYVNRGMGKEAWPLVERYISDSTNYKYSPSLSWWTAIAAYQIQAYRLAYNYFSQVAYSPYASAEMRSAAYFWLARVQLKNGNFDEVAYLLEKSSYFHYTFYGLLAQRALGFKGSFVWGLPNILPQDIHFLLQIPSVRRGFALASIGRISDAEEELTHIISYLPANVTEEILILASQAGLARVSYDIGKEIRRHQGMVVSAALYPIPIWSPESGFRINPALIYAFMRQESTFKIAACSYAGARGLMQLMPSTASILSHTSYFGYRRNKLYNPQLNVSLGQQYIYQLVSRLHHNLFMIVGAYNAGSNNMIRWFSHTERYHGDPLLFIETLLNNQTRNYIKQVLASFWIYQSRFGQYQSSMDQILSGEWPTYHADESFTIPVVVAFND